MLSWLWIYMTTDWRMWWRFENWYSFSTIFLSQPCALTNVKKAGMFFSVCFPLKTKPWWSGFWCIKPLRRRLESPPHCISLNQNRDLTGWIHAPTPVQHVHIRRFVIRVFWVFHCPRFKDGFNAKEADPVFLIIQNVHVNDPTLVDLADYFAPGCSANSALLFSYTAFLSSEFRT